MARESLYSGPEYAAARIKYANNVLKTCCIEIDAEGKLEDPKGFAGRLQALMEKAAKSMAT